MSMSTSFRDEPETVVAYFAGTGLTFNKDEPGYVSPKEMGFKQPQSDETNDTRMSFLNLATLAGDQKRFGYDGCHERGGGAFAFGVRDPANHLHEKLLADLKGNDKKIKLVLDGHSRGCLSALLAAKKISEDPALRNRVDIILNLQDPVPGNLKGMVSIDVASIATISRQLKDLSHCTSIKEAHITVQEKGNMDYAFNVLVPKFAQSTQLEVEYLPGTHTIQEDDRYPLGLDSEGKYYTRHAGLYQLGIYKSLQIYLENNVKIQDSPSLLHHLKSVNDHFFEILKQYNKPEWQLEINAAADLYHTLNNKIEAMQRKNPPVSKQALEQFVKDAQVSIYQNLLNDYKNTDKKIHDRQLHFEGEYRALCDAKEASHLNTRHLLLQAASAAHEAKPLLGYHGKRPELGRKFGDHIEKFLETTLDLDLESHFKTKPIQEITSLLDSKIALYEPYVKNEIKRQFTEYEIRHANQIRKWQTDFHQSNQPAVSKSTILDTINKDFTLNLKSMIESIPSWKTGPLGGTKIKMTVNGKVESRVLPKNIAEIYKICCNAASQPNPDWSKHFEAIAYMGFKASNNKPFSLFGLNKRDPNAQKLYDILKQTMFSDPVFALKEQHKTAMELAPNSKLPDIIARLESVLGGLSKSSSKVSIDILEKYKSAIHKAENQIHSKDREQQDKIATLASHVNIILDNAITSVKNSQMKNNQSKTPDLPQEEIVSENYRPKF